PCFRIAMILRCVACPSLQFSSPGFGRTHILGPVFGGYVKTIYVSTANRLYAGYVSSMQLLYLLQGRARPKLQLPRSCNCFRTRSACAELGSIASALCKCNFA